MAGAYGRAIHVNKVIKERPIFNVGRYAGGHVLRLCQLSFNQPCALIPIEERGLGHSRHASTTGLI